MLSTWLLTIESLTLTAYVIIGEIRLARIDAVPVNHAIHLIFMWAFTLMSWALVVAAWHPWRI
jgi:hypothetical protein